MTLAGVFLTVIIAVAVGIFFYYVFRTSGPWGRLWTFITILILAGLAGSVWISPIGPKIHNVAWVPAFFVILFVALLLTAATPKGVKGKDNLQVDREPSNEGPASTIYAVMGLFFYILVLFLVFAFIYGFLNAL